MLNGPPFTPNQNQNEKAKFKHNVGNIKHENLSDQQINVESCELHGIDIKNIKSRNVNKSSESFDQETKSETCQPLMTIETR